MWGRLIRTLSDLLANNDNNSDNAENKMNRDEQRQKQQDTNRLLIADYCQNCSHCKFDPQRGLLCALTDDYGNCQNECEQFEPNEAYIAQKREKIKRQEEQREEYSSTIAVGFTYLFCLVSMLIGDDSPKTTIFVLLAAGVTLAGAGCACYLYRRSKLKQITYGLLNRKKIMEFLRIEGYCPKIDDDGSILFKHDGNNYMIHTKNERFFVCSSWDYQGCDIELLQAIANKVMNECIIIKVYVSSDENTSVVTFSVESLISYEVEMQAQLSQFISIIEVSSRQFAEILNEYNEQQNVAQRNYLKRRQSIYNREYGWFADVIDAITDGKVSSDFLSDESALRQEFQHDCDMECVDLWNTFKILRTERYGDYKLLLYQFPEPKEVPEAIYGAVLLDMKTNHADYYTLEYSYNDKWVFGATSRGKHANYGEVDTPDLEQFVAWIFSSEKRLCNYTDLYRNTEAAVS